MSVSKIIHIATHNPSMKVSQQQALDDVLKCHNVSVRGKELYQRFFLDPGIQFRYFGVDKIADIFQEHYDDTIVRFQRVATHLATQAARSCLQKAHLTTDQLDAMIITTCTGYLCPGLTSYVSESLRLKDNIFLLDLVGLGCAAALPAIRMADNFLQCQENRNVMVICVEVCSAAFSTGEEVDLLLSNAIFGDGAVACLITNRKEVPGLGIYKQESLLLPQFRDVLRFKIKNSRLCNVLSKKVPGLVARAVENLMDRFEGMADDYQFAFHPGGRTILDKISEVLNLDEGQMAMSREIFRDYGNMSSPSVLFVLKRIMEEGLPLHKPVLAFSYGAGMSVHATQMKWIDED